MVKLSDMGRVLRFERPPEEKRPDAVEAFREKLEPPRVPPKGGGEVIEIEKPVAERLLALEREKEALKRDLRETKKGAAYYAKVLAEGGGQILKGEQLEGAVRDIREEVDALKERIAELDRVVAEMEDNLTGRLLHRRRTEAK